MTDATMTAAMLAAGPAIDEALMGNQESAIAVLVEAGLDAEYARGFLVGSLERIASDIKARDAYTAELARQERVAYNITCGMSAARAEACS